MRSLPIRTIKIFNYSRRQEKINQIIKVSEKFVNSVNDKHSNQQIQDNYKELLNLTNLFLKSYK